MNSDFKFLQNPVSKKWMILAPRRAKRPDVAKGMEPRCPFCPGREGEEKELYRVRGNTQNPSTDSADSLQASSGQAQNNAEESLSLVQRTVPLSSVQDTNWSVRVLNNKFPFAPIHEVIIHSPDHHKNFDQLPTEQTEHILKTYRERFNAHKEKGQVYIFHNRGEAGGESLPHPHTQLAVVPSDVKMEIPRLDPSASERFSPKPFELDPENSKIQEDTLADEPATVTTPHFYMFCPKTSQWPDEVWIAPKKRGRLFGEITDEEIKDLAKVLPQLIRILDLRHGKEPLPFNFHIYPGGDWYLRLMPRLKTLGGFELGTGIFINTQDPADTIAFIKEHFENPDEEKIKREHQAEYKRAA